MVTFHHVYAYNRYFYLVWLTVFNNHNKDQHKVNSAYRWVFCIIQKHVLSFSEESLAPFTWPQDTSQAGTEISSRDARVLIIIE